MILRHALLVCCAAVLALADPTQQYVVSLSDQSPIISYTPSIIGNGTNSWNVSYSQSSWSQFNSQQLNTGSGTSTHWTNTSNAIVSFSFVGTGFTAYGKVQGQSNIVLQIDGATITAQPAATMGPYESQPTLASATGLTYGLHQISLTIKGTDGVEFYGTDLLLASGNSGATYTNITANCSDSNLTLNPSFLWSSDDWDVTTTTVSNNMIAFTAHENASVSFTPPSNTSLLIVYGDTDPNTAEYAVTLDSQAYDDGSSKNLQPMSQSFLPVTPWAASNQVIYVATLEAGHAYAVSIETFGPSAANLTHVDFAISSVVFISSSSDGASNTTTSLTPSSTSSSGGRGHVEFNYGPIIGGTIGGVAAVVIAGVLFWYIRRLKRRHAEAEERNKVPHVGAEKAFDVDGDSESPDRMDPQVVPFQNPSADPYDRLAPADTVRSEKGPHPGFESTIAPSGSTGSVSSPNPTMVPPTPREPTSSGTGTNALEGLDPSDPAFQRKWEVLHSLDGEGTSTASQASPTSTQPRAREVDAGRLEGEDTLPPDYNPAWAQRRPQ